MPALFHYKAYDEENRFAEGDIAAASRREAAAELAARGLHPVHVVEKKQSSRKGARPFPRKRLALFAGEWASLLEAGLTMTESLSLLESQADKKERARWERIAASITAGHGIWESFESSGLFPPFFISLVKVGEMTGTLPQELRRLSSYYKKEEALIEKMKHALAYPLFVSCFALAVFFLILTFILPSFSLLFTSLGIEMGGAARVCLRLGLFLKQQGLVLLLLVLLILLFLVWLGTTKQGRRRAARLFYRADWFRRILLIRFCYTLAAFLESGKPLTASLEDCKTVLGNQEAARAISFVISRIQRGGSFSEALEESGFSFPLLSGLVHVGMESGELPRFLTQAADMMSQETEQRFQRFRAILEPALLLFVGGLTAFVIFSVMLPVFDAVGKVFVH